MPTPSSPARTIVPHSFIAAFLLFLSFVLYGASLKGEFVIDAHRVIADNPIIKQPKLFYRIFTDKLFAPYEASTRPGVDQNLSMVVKGKASHFEYNYYRPVTMMTFALDYRFWRLDPFGYKLTNLLIHLLNCFLVYLLLYRLCREQDIALLSGVLFCALPVHEWVVNYVVGRSDLLQAAFQLSSLILVLGFLETKRVSKLAAGLLLFGLALFSRELALVHPLLVILLCWYKEGHWLKALRLSLPFWGIGILYIIFRANFLPMNQSAVMGDLNSFAENAVHWLNILVAYCIRFVLPWVVQGTVFPGMKSSYLKLITVGALLVAYTSWSIKVLIVSKRREFIFGLLWILANFLPFYFLIPQFRFSGPVLSEHYLYLASVGFVVNLSALLLFFRGWLKIIFITGVIFYFSLLVVNNNSYWKQEEKLLGRVKSLDGNYHYVSADQIFVKYDFDKEHMRGLIQQAADPGETSKWLGRLGIIELREKDYAASLKHLTESLSLVPDNISSLLALAFVRYEMEQKEDALESLQRIIAIDPEQEEAQRFIGTIYYLDGQFPMALPYLEKAAFLNPDNLDNLLYSGAACFLEGKKGPAKDHFEQSIRLRAHDSYPYRFIAAELFNHQYFEEAILYLERAKVRFPHDAKVFVLLGKVYFNLGKTREAVSLWEKVLVFDPANIEAKNCLLRNK